MKYFVIFLLLVLVSCGPSKEEIEAQAKKTQDSINQIIELEKLKAAEQERLKLEQEQQLAKERELEAKKKAEQDRLNNPLNYLTFELKKDYRFLKNERLQVVVINNHDSKNIIDVKFRVFAYAKSGTQLGYHDEVIYDFVKPSHPYNRMIDFDKFPNGSDSYNVKFISAKFK